MTATSALKANLWQLRGVNILDNVSAGPAGTQAGATAITSQCTRVTIAANNGSLVLRSMTGVDAPAICFVLNDSPNTIKVFCGAGENHNGSGNGSISIPSGSAGVFVRNEATKDWRSGVIS